MEDPNIKEAENAAETESGKEERVITLRPLNMEDFRQAKNQVSCCPTTTCYLNMYSIYNFWDKC